MTLTTDVEENQYGPPPDNAGAFFFPQACYRLSQVLGFPVLPVLPAGTTTCRPPADLQQRSPSLLWEQRMRRSAAEDMKHTAFGLLYSPSLQIFNEENFKRLLLPFFPPH